LRHPSWSPPAAPPRDTSDTFASGLVMTGAGVRTVHEVGGWRSLAM